MAAVCACLLCQSSLERANQRQKLHSDSTKHVLTILGGVWWRAGDSGDRNYLSFRSVSLSPMCEEHREVESSPSDLLL